MELFEIKQVKRIETPIKIGIQGVSGAGKSLSSLLLSKGLAGGDLSRVIAIDTENSLALYDIGNFKILNFKPPHTLERYVAAIDTCLKESPSVLILDGISQFYQTILQMHGSMQQSTNSFNAWARLTPIYNYFIQKIVQCPCHVICTIRMKQNLVIQTAGNKIKIEKIGLKPVCRPDTEFELTTVLNMNHEITVSKDRLGLFNNMSPFVIDENTGKLILDYLKTNNATQRQNFIINPNNTHNYANQTNT